MALVQVQYSSDLTGTWHDPTNGVDVSNGDTIRIRLVDSAVDTWILQCIGTDEVTTTPPILTGVSSEGLVTSPSTVVTFVLPLGVGVGRALIFSSTAGGTTHTFGIYSPTDQGYRVGAFREAFESNATFGWLAKFNGLIRRGTVPGATGPAGATGSTGATGATGGTGLAGLPGEDGRAWYQDASLPPVLTTGGAASTVLGTIAPSLANNTTCMVGIRLTVVDQTAPGTPGYWEYSTPLTRLGDGTWGVVGVVDTSYAESSLPAGCVAGLQINSTLGLQVTGNPGANDTTWQQDFWFSTPHSTGATGAVAPNPAIPSPTVVVTEPTAGFTWTADSTYFVSGTSVSTGAALSGVELRTSEGGHLADAVVYEGGTRWAAHVTAGSPGALQILARATNILGGRGDSSTISGTVEMGIDTNPPTWSQFSLGQSATSLTVSLNMAATDTSGTVYYWVGESTNAPDPNAAGWLNSPITEWLFGAPGNVALYGWAMDSSQNITARQATTTTITLPDTTRPAITAFAMPATAETLNVGITSFTASDNVDVTGYQVTESSTPPLSGSSEWVTPAPSNFIFSAQGLRTAYPWVRDAAGNVSLVYGSPANVEITLTDTTRPEVTTFTLASAQSNSRTIAITTWTYSDDTGVSAWNLTTSNTPPTTGWVTSRPTTFTSDSDGIFQVYPWVRDDAGNVNLAYATPASITIDTIPPLVTPGTIPATSTSRTISISEFTATDVTSGVYQYAVTEVNNTTGATWASSPQTGFTVSSDGPKTLYFWARDTVLNENAVGTPATCSVDTVAPVMTGGALPASTAIATVSVSEAVTATDAVGVTGYAYTIDTATPPVLGSFTLPAPSSVTFSATGSHVVRLYARDLAGNISTARSTTCDYQTAATPEITAFAIPATATALSNIAINTLTINYAPTEYAIVVQLASAAAPSTPTEGWTTSIPTTFTCPGSADGYFRVYVWARNAAGTSAYASDEVFVMVGNMSTLTLVEVVSPTRVRVTASYNFDSAAQANDFTAQGGGTIAVTGGALTATSGTEAALSGMRWVKQMQVESASIRVQSSGNTLANMILGHAEDYAGLPFNPNPGVMLTKTIYDASYEIDVDGDVVHGPDSWTPIINTYYTFEYVVSPTFLSITCMDNSTSLERTSGGPFTPVADVGRVSWGHYNASGAWDTITLTGLVAIT